jgi:hypothetical protein
MLLHLRTVCLTQIVYHRKSTETIQKASAYAPVVQLYWVLNGTFLAKRWEQMITGATSAITLTRAGARIIS